MNTCKPNRGTKTAVVGGLCGFGLPAALLLLAAAAFGNLSAPLRLAALGGGLLLAVLLSAAVYWTLYVVPPTSLGIKTPSPSTSPDRSA